jgi:hypothetical protein
VNDVLANHRDPRVQTYAIWVPMRGGAETDVPEATATLPDPRVRHFWDTGFALHAFAPVLGLPAGREAWDVYLIYKPGTRWDGDTPPAPDYWMHQLQGVENGPFLDPNVLGQHLAQILGAAT